MEKQPVSSTESTLAKIEKNGKKKIQRIWKKIYFPFTWRTSISRNYPNFEKSPDAVRGA